jgi:hypothetical protein
MLHFFLLRIGNITIDAAHKGHNFKVHGLIVDFLFFAFVLSLPTLRVDLIHLSNPNQPSHPQLDHHSQLCIQFCGEQTAKKHGWIAILPLKLTQKCSILMHFSVSLMIA